MGEPKVNLTDPMEVLIQAERVVLSDDSTADDIRKAIAQVDELGRKDYSSAIRRTLRHHADHGAPE